MKKLKTCCALAIFFDVAVACALPVPKFEEYRVSTLYGGASKAPDVASMDIYEIHACFGGSPQGFAGSSVNFAGHFVIQACSCGSGCHYLVMWDAITGRMFYLQPPLGASGAIDVGPYEDGRTSPSLVYEGEHYQSDSALLIIEGCHEQTCDCAKRYYRWTGSEFKVILKHSVLMPAACRNKP